MLGDCRGVRAGGVGQVEILDLVMLFDETVEKQAEDLKKMSAENVADIHMVSFF